MSIFKNRTGIYYRLINPIKKLVYLITVSNQLPSIIVNKNKSFLLLIVLGVISTIFIRIQLVHLNNLSPILLFIVYIIISFSIFYLLYIQINSIIRLYNSIKLIPN